MSGPPAAEPVLLAELRTHLRIDHDGEDATLQSLLATARDDVERQTGLALLRQAWRVVADLPADRRIALTRYPVMRVVSVAAFGADGERADVPAGQWRLDRFARPAAVDLAALAPATDCSNGIEIDYEAGHGDTATDVPDLLKRAILQLAAHLYEHRSGSMADGQVSAWPSGYERLIAPFRLARL
ncbi:head-tail connector protein [Zhengella sp. ZM62]|uniref:head-tail connector protein n=1 Tax=Zhengella sedimenti TaxID=3390035 RepID=UPI0039759273